MLPTTGLLALMTLLTVAGDEPLPGSWADAAQTFGLGPLPPTVDLRNMMAGHVVRRCCESLDAVHVTSRLSLASVLVVPTGDGSDSHTTVVPSLRQYVYLAE